MSNTTTTANGTARRGKLGQRVAYACGNLGQSAFYNALSTYFVVYVTSSLFAGVDKGVATKLIGIITGGLAADSGEVLWCGRPAHGIAFRRVLGYMPQQQGLYDSYTGRRFLAYMAALKEIPRAAVPGEVARVAAAVNLTDELDKRLAAYSGGMKQRLLLAAALLGDPRLLILDEPTAGLDPRERVRLRTLLAGMAQDRIILVATHVVSDVESVATKVILLRAGKIVDAAPVPDLIAAYAPGGGLEDVYLNVFGEGDGK